VCDVAHCKLSSAIERKTVMLWSCACVGVSAPQPLSLVPSGGPCPKSSQLERDGWMGRGKRARELPTCLSIDRHLQIYNIVNQLSAALPLLLAN